MLMLSATPGVQAMDNAPSATKLVLTGVLSTPLRVPKSSVPKRPPVPVLTEHLGTTVALTPEGLGGYRPGVADHHQRDDQGKKGARRPLRFRADINTMPSWLNQ